MGQFNLLKDAYCIKNTNLCRYDSLNGYTTDFSINGDVNGWDIYSGICMYGVWNSVLFGTSIAKNCFIGRSNPFVSVQAEKYYVLKINMKLTLPDNYGKKVIPTKGKVMWQSTSDPTWTDTKSKEFDLNITDQWYTYIINLGEARYWLGNVNNLRIYPFTDGFDDIKFMIKSIIIDSVTDYTCLNTQCSYYSQFVHPCPGIGTRASVTSTVPKYVYTTLSGISETLILNIDGYGDEHINLGNNKNLSGVEMAKVLVDKISRVGFGAYAYAEVTYQEEAGTLSIFSGAMSEGKSITVGGSAAVVLGFANYDGTSTYSFEHGEASATGFDFGSSRRLRGFELNALIDSNTEKAIYYHNPNQYNVEAGRRDFADSMSSNDGPLSDKVDYYDFIDASQKLIIDASHPVNDSGRLSKIWVNGNYISEYDDSESLFEAPKIYILRPDKYNQVEIIHELLVPIEDADLRYTMNHVTFRVDCDIVVNKGDLVGFFNMKVLAPFSARNKAVNGVYFEIPCGSSGPISGKFNIGSPKAKGVVGISFYARSDRLQRELQLDIDIGERTNLKEVALYGKELSSFFEYNVGCCLDMDWQVELYNGTHWHTAKTCTTHSRTINVEHRNKAYGIECLADCITTVDGGQSGTYYLINSIGPEVSDIGKGVVCNTDPDFYSGIETYGDHSYFYVNGDAEWLNGGCCNVLGDDGSCEKKKLIQGEFKQPWTANVYEFEFDPISFYLLFPNDKWLDIYRSVIYFKEPDNFKRYSLSYYLGASGPQGNAEEVHFNYIPEFNSITLDGITITKEAADGDPLTQVYSKTIFQNPVPWALPNYKSGVCTNWEVYQTIMNLDFNVLRHDFDTINCRGFKVHTTWHKSTKIIEMELYSKIPVEPTLLDNIRMQFSIYGDRWNELSFVVDELDDEKVVAMVSHNPRYFRLQLQSQDLFELKELTASLSEDHLKFLDCTNVILQECAPKYQMTLPKLLEIENTYDIPLDLSVSIPSQLFKESYLLSWIRFDSEDTTVNGEVGPGALVRKSDDYPLYLKQGQIAINTPAYYLKNLIDGKNSYVYENEHEWSFYKTLVHDEDVNYTNKSVGSVTSIGFLPVSSKFWKLCVHEAATIDISNLKLFFNSNSTIIPVVMDIEFDRYSDGEYLDASLWGRQDVPINNSSLEMEFLSDGTDHYEVCSSFFIERSFDVRVTATVHAYSGNGIKGPAFKFFSANDPSTAVLICWYSYGALSAYRLYTQYQGGAWVQRCNTTASWYAGTSKNLKIIRDGDTFSLYYQSSGTFYLAFSYTFTSIGSKVLFAMCAFNENPYSVTSKISFDSLALYSGYAFLGDLDSTFLVINPVDIHKVYIQAKADEFSDKHETTFDLINHVIKPAVLVEDDFSNGIWYDMWTAYVGTGNSTFIEKNNAIYPFISAGDFIYIEKEFLPGAVSYDVEVLFNLEFPTTMQYFIEFLTPMDTVSFKLGISGNGDNSALVRIESILPAYIYAQQEAYDDLVPYSYMFSTITRSISEYAEGFKFTCSKSYKKFDNIKLTNTSGSIIFYNGTDLNAPFDRISKIRISYFSPSTSVYNQLRDYSTTYVRFRALPKLSDLEAIVFEFTNSQPIDAIKIVQNTVGINYPSIWLSNNDTNDYYLWAKNFTTTGVLSTPNESFFGDNCYQSGENPYNCLLSTNVFTVNALDSEHFLVYDFGAGNYKRIGYIYYKSYYYLAGYTPYGEAAFKFCRIYGSNTFKTYFVKTNSLFNKVRVDVRDAVLLHEFTINHNSTNTAYNDIYLTKPTDYRYLIFHYPYSDSGESSVLYVDDIKLYGVYNQISSSNIVLSNNCYTNYLAIDLGLPHRLDFIRNYGPKNNLIDLCNSNNIDYSNTNTSDINVVEWTSNIPKLLFNFLDYTDSVNTDRCVFTSGDLALFMSGGPLIDQGHIGFNISANTGGILSVEHTSDFILGSNDFTIDFWFKRTRTGQEGVVGQISGNAITSAFSFTFSLYNYLVFTAYYSGSFFELQTLAGVVDTDWHHVAVCRYNNYISLYLDGKIQVSKSVEGISINECVERLVLGQVDLDIFRGYLDEFRFLLGTASWISNFEVPTIAYTISHQKGDKSSARWLKIPFLCGDGVERNINKLGVYPDITVPYLPEGGYNCEWECVYDRLSNYTSTIQNIAPNATIIGEDLISITFDDSTSLSYWDNLSFMANTSYIYRTDFGVEASHAFWATASDTFTAADSYYNYDSGFLKISLAAEESGSIVFTTNVVYGDFVCELKYSDLSEFYSNGLNYTLLIHTEDGTSYGIKRIQVGTSERFSVYKETSILSTIYPTINTGIKFEKEAGELRIYTSTSTGFELKYTFTNQEELGDGDIYFSFIVTKVPDTSVITFNLYSFDVYGGAELSTDVTYQLVPSEYGSYALGCTSTVPVQDGPILKHPSIGNGSQVQYIEFYYCNSGQGGGGIAFVDSNSVEVLGIATINPGWLVNSSAGWEVVEYSPTSGVVGWYRVKVNFEWGSGSVIIEWEDINANFVQTFTKSLITSTNIKELQIKGTFGLSWGPDLLDIKFDNITINPTFMYLNTSVPSNCISGDTELQGYENCWGFPASISEPTLILDLGKVYSVDKFVMYSRPEDSDYTHIVNDFDIYGTTSLSGTFELLVSESGFTESYGVVGNNIYELESPVYVQYVKLVIKAYSKPDIATSVYIQTRDGGGEYLTLDGGFVREFQIWRSSGSIPMTSEVHPVVCMNLKDQFNLTSHVIVSPSRIDNESKLWNNSDVFYQFSADSTDDPRKVAFSTLGGATTFPFSYTDTFMKTDGEVGTYLLNSDIFLPSGHYLVSWESYNTIEPGSLQLLMFGVESQTLSSTNIGNGWIVHTNEFQLYSSDYYSLQIRCSSETYGDAWGVRNIYFKSFDNTSKWVALRRNTATNFVWTTEVYDADIDNMAGVDLLQYLKLYADGQHRPTEYWWFWETGISTLENESINVKSGKRALKVNYPASDAVDYLRFLEGDHFGLDKDFSIKDSLSFWFYIEDVDKLYIDEGGFIFGSVDGYKVSSDYYEDGHNPSASAAFYVWKFRDLALSTGWNYIRLQFDKNYMTSPTPNINGSLSKLLDFRNFVTSSFRVVFKGVGEAFYMLFDDLKIERNWYYDEVVYGNKGLCLTWGDYAEIPLSGLDTRCGTFEAWLKLYTSTGGLDHFNTTASRTLCTLVDTSNVSITLSIQSGSWFEIGVGDTKSKYTRLCVDPTEVYLGNVSKKIDDVIHIALVWSSDATSIGGGDTIRFYVNGELYLKGQVTWDVGDNKNVLLRLGGGNTYLANSDDADGSAIFSNVKLYNYCKTIFEINKLTPSDIDNITPNDFVQISSDGVEFYSSRDEALPIEYLLVQPGDKVQVYTRVDKSRIDELDKITGSIDITWKMPV